MILMITSPQSYSTIGNSGGSGVISTGISITMECTSPESKFSPISNSICIGIISN